MAVAAIFASRGDIFIACSVTDLLLQVNTGCISSGVMLANALARHYAAHIIAYGLFGVMSALACSGVMCDVEKYDACFVHERKHKIIKFGGYVLI